MSKIDGELLQKALHVLEDEGKVSDEQFFLIKSAIREWYTFKSKVEEMQKTLEWYADEQTYMYPDDEKLITVNGTGHYDYGKLAREALKGGENR